MVKERVDLLELLRKGGMDGDVDFLREALRVLVEGIMDAEVSSRIGAEYGERSPAERVTQRNGYRSRAWDTRVGTMDLHIPKLREGSYFPSLLEPRRRSERALLAVTPGPARRRGRGASGGVGAGQGAGRGWREGSARHWPPGGGRQRGCGYGRVCSVRSIYWVLLVSGRVSVLKPIIPDSQEHPLASSRAVPKAVLRWIRG